MTNRELIETFFRRVWVGEDLDAIAGLMAPDTEVRGLQDLPQIGPNEFRPFAEATLNQLSEMRITIEKFVENGDWSAALISVKAKARATGEPVRFTGQVMVRCGDDRIQEAYNHMDFVSMNEQLGLMPQHTLSHCLGGGCVAVA